MFSVAITDMLSCIGNKVDTYESELLERYTIKDKAQESYDYVAAALELPDATITLCQVFTNEEGAFVKFYGHCIHLDFSIESDDGLVSAYSNEGSREVYLEILE